MSVGVGSPFGSPISLAPLTFDNLSRLKVATPPPRSQARTSATPTLLAPRPHRRPRRRLPLVGRCGGAASRRSFRYALAAGGGGAVREKGPVRAEQGIGEMARGASSFRRARRAC